MRTRKNKIILGSLIAASSIGTIAPIVSMTSCSKDNTSTTGNLMSEYNPESAQLPESAVSNWEFANDVINKYFKEIQRKSKFFVEDILYTMSRGLTEYNNRLENSNVQIKSYYYNATIDNVTADEKVYGLTFDLQMDMSYDYSGTDETVMKNLGLYYYKWNSKTKFRFVFDFDTTKFLEYSINAKRRQVTFIDKIAQIGVSEIGSTVQLLSEHGSADKVDGGHIEMNTTTPEETKYHFIVPQQDYWNSVGHLDTYSEHIAEINALKANGHYNVISLLDEYLGNEPYIAQNSPNTMDIGAYHMGLGSMERTFEYQRDDSTLYGFNYSNDPNINYKKFTQFGQWWYDEDTKTFTLPTKKKVDDTSVTIDALGDNAFNGSISNKCNIAIPEEVEEIVIPAEYKSVGANAIVFNPEFEESAIKTITIHRRDGLYPCTLGDNAFANMPNVNVINISDFNVDDYQHFQTKWKDAFKNLHLDKTKRMEGIIALPNNIDLSGMAGSQWKNAIEKIGLHAYVESDPQEEMWGWELYSEQE